MHRVETRDPFADDGGRFEDRVATLLFGDAPVPMAEAAALMPND